MENKITKWDSYKALGATIGRHTKYVAKEIGLSHSLVSKWKEPPAQKDNSQSGAINPLDRIERIMKAAAAKNPQNAHLPIYWLCAQFGFLPPRKAHSLKTGDKEEILLAVLKWNEQFGETAKEIKKTLKDGVVQDHELETVYLKAMKHIECVYSVIGTMESQNGSHKKTRNVLKRVK